MAHDAMAATRRPMRAVHHTASQASMIRGGSGTQNPDEITPAHLGVLFLDELAEFSRTSLGALRQSIHRAEPSLSRVYPPSTSF
jgi:magnesium chelatase family protein